VSFNALDIGGAAIAVGAGDYRMVIDVPGGAFGTATVDLEGHPAGDVNGDGSFDDRIPARSQFAHVNIEQRAVFEARRDVVDIAKCNTCHDAAGAGISLHGANRVSEAQVCVLCHNNNATDVARRPADPSTTPDGKAEESIDFKRMIHQIHTGQDLENGIVIYGFGGSVHDFSSVDFIGNSNNCETCHLPGTYSTEAAAATSPSSIDTGADLMDPSDDLNISPVASVCSSCHDNAAARDHMLLNGASFQALDKDIL
jgi:OmcA/MtrC family decaheme c-type cytochrome